MSTARNPCRGRPAPNLAEHVPEGRADRGAAAAADADAADIGLVRDLDAQHLDRDRIGEGQGRRCCDADLEGNRRRA